MPYASISYLQYSSPYQQLAIQYSGAERVTSRWSIGTSCTWCSRRRLCLRGRWVGEPKWVVDASLRWWQCHRWIGGRPSSAVELDSREWWQSTLCSAACTPLSSCHPHISRQQQWRGNTPRGSCLWWHLWRSVAEWHANVDLSWHWYGYAVKEWTSHPCNSFDCSQVGSCDLVKCGLLEWKNTQKKYLSVCRTFGHYRHHHHRPITECFNCNGYVTRTFGHETMVSVH